MINFIADWWWLGLVVLAIGLAIGGKPSSATGLGLLGVFLKIRLIIGGQKKRKQESDIQLKREKAYEEIDNRGTDRDDVIERLRDGKF